jgi:hypothetical protein
MKMQCITCNNIVENEAPPFFIDNVEEVGQFYHEECLPTDLKNSRTEAAAIELELESEHEQKRVYYEENCGLGKVGLELGGYKDIFPEAKRGDDTPLLETRCKKCLRYFFYKDEEKLVCKRCTKEEQNIGIFR